MAVLHCRPTSVPVPGSPSLAAPPPPLLAPVLLNCAIVLTIWSIYRTLSFIISPRPVFVPTGNAVQSALSQLSRAVHSSEVMYLVG